MYKQIYFFALEVSYNIRHYISDDQDLTPFEKILKKRKEKQKQKKLQKPKSEEENDDSDSNGSSDDVPSDIDMNDPYFAEEFSNSEFKKAKINNKKDKKGLIDSADEEEQKRKAELELLLDEDDGKAHFSLKKIQEAETSKKSKRKKKLKEKMANQKQALPEFEINLNDQRFSALYTSHLYNIDPTDSNFKKTKNMEKLIQEKLKRRPADTPSENEKHPKKSREDAELNLLVKNLKRKTKSASMTK